jgi:hypothetical protein
MLLSRDDVGADSKDNIGRSALSRGAERGNAEVSRMLLACNNVEPVSSCRTGTHGDVEVVSSSR